MTPCSTSSGTSAAHQGVNIRTAFDSVPFQEGTFTASYLQQDWGVMLGSHNRDSLCFRKDVLRPIEVHSLGNHTLLCLLGSFEISCKGRLRGNFNGNLSSSSTGLKKARLIFSATISDVAEQGSRKTFTYYLLLSENSNSPICLINSGF